MKLAMLFVPSIKNCVLKLTCFDSTRVTEVTEVTIYHRAEGIAKHRCKAKGLLPGEPRAEIEFELLGKLRYDKNLGETWIEMVNFNRKTEDPWFLGSPILGHNE